MVADEPLGLDEVATFHVGGLLVEGGELAGVQGLAAAEPVEVEALGPEGGLCAVRQCLASLKVDVGPQAVGPVLCLHDATGEVVWVPAGEDDDLDRAAVVDCGLETGGEGRGVEVPDLVAHGGAVCVFAGLEGVVDDQEVGGTARGGAVEADAEIAPILGGGPDIGGAAVEGDAEVGEDLLGDVFFAQVTGLASEVGGQHGVVRGGHDEAPGVAAHVVGREVDRAVVGLAVPGRHGDEQVVGAEGALFEAVEGVDQLELERRERALGVAELEVGQIAGLGAGDALEVLGG